MSATNLKSSSARGMLSLSYKMFFVNILRAFSLVILARFLGPRDYGIFGIINGFVSVAAFFTDIGIGGVLIQQHEEPNEAQLKSYFGVQLVLSSSLAILISLFAPWICLYYQLDTEEIFMIRILSLVLPLTVLSAIPKMFLQRWLEFGKYAKVEMTEAAIVSFMQISLAMLGFGVWSLIAGSLSRSVVAFVLSYRYTKKFYLPKFEIKVIKTFLRFGVPFQFNSIIPVLRGIIMPGLLKLFFTVESMGLIFWSLSVTSLPHEIAANYNQVSFSALSKLQKLKDQMKSLASRGMEIMLLVMSFIFGLGASVGVAIINILFDEKWSNVKPFLSLAVFGVSLIAIRHLTTSVMNASSRPAVRLAIETVAVVLEIPVFLFFAANFGLNGYFYSLILIGILTLIASFYAIKEYLNLMSYYRLFVVTVATFLSFFITRILNLTENFLGSALAFIMSFIILTVALDKTTWADYMIIFKKLRENE
ncbi:MAG: oligosaccharide flippase family protein [Oligoflexia bacterium]|nr:oligosaccharide flippase family protein [Oligoflexia bacterium]